MSPNAFHDPTNPWSFYIAPVVEPDEESEFEYEDLDSDIDSDEDESTIPPSAIIETPPLTEWDTDEEIDDLPELEDFTN